MITRRGALKLEGGPLAPADEIEGIPPAVLEDTAVVDLVHEVQLYHTGADVSGTALTRVDSNVGQGPIRRCDVSRVYKFANTLYTLEMTGAQLRRYLEWSAGFFRQYREGDVTLAFDPDMPLYNYDMLQGVCYQVNVAREPGNRIEGLSWPDGRAVADGDSFAIVVNNYRATTQLLSPGMIFEEGDLPKLLEADVQGGLGVREMIVDYIENVKGGKVEPTCDGNWRIVGNDWDEGLHQRAVELLAEGAIALEVDDDKHLVSHVITEDDLAKAP